MPSGIEFDFDAIVVGSGAGGASFAHGLAQAGKRTLVVERGRRPAANLAPLDEQATLIDREPYDDRQIHLNGQQSRLYMGGVLGGSTAVYGGVMLRPSSDDFTPGKHYGDRLPRELWEWPIAYEQLQPYYDRAESLFKLTGRRNENYGPLHAPHEGTADNVLPLAPINERLIAKNRPHGLKAFQLPLTIDSTLCHRCDSCAGFLCPHSARRSSAHIVDDLKATGNLELRTGVEVDRLELGSDGTVRHVVLRDLEQGTITQVSGKCVALAAGALGSTAVMLRTGIENSLIGRNYMMHYSSITVGVFPGQTGADDTFVKQVGFSDYYFGTDDCPSKMGIIQSLPAPGPLMMAKSGLNRVPKLLLKQLRKRMLPMVGIVEDLPNENNRVQLNQDGSVALDYEFSSFDVERGRSLGKKMSQILRRAGALATLSKSFPSYEHVAHQCGTLRFGTSARSAVADANCRVFGSDNLFVVDGSVLPTSLGVGPSLTIAANALRVADVALETI